MTAETDVPLDAAVLLGCLTRLRTFGAPSTKSMTISGHVPLDRITAMEATPGRKWQRLTITLDGGQSIEMEARGAGHALATTFQHRHRPTG